MRGVGDYLFSVWGNRHWKLYGVRLRFFVIGGTGRDIPGQCSIQMLDYAHIHWLFLVVAHFDFERFGRAAFSRLHDVVRASAFSGQVEGVASVEADGLVARRVVDDIFAGEFDLAVIVTAVKTDSPLGQRHAEMIGLRVNELAHHPDFRIRFGAVVVIVADVVPAPAVVAVEVDLGAVVNVKLFGGHSGSVDELHLFCLAVAQCSGAFERVEVVFVKRLLGHGRIEARASYASCLHVHGPAIHSRLNFVHIAGHELDAGVFEGFAGFVVHSDPAYDVDQFAFFGAQPGCSRPANSCLQ